MNLPFEPLKRAALQDLSFKAIFLVAITSAHWVSELQTLFCWDPFLFFSGGSFPLGCYSLLLESGHLAPLLF